MVNDAASAGRAGAQTADRPRGLPWGQATLLSESAQTASWAETGFDLDAGWLRARAVLAELREDFE